jgi:hypothetical protein
MGVWRAMTSPLKSTYTRARGHTSLERADALYSRPHAPQRADL